MNSSAISLTLPAAEQEFQLLQNLDALLVTVTQSLGCGEPQTVPEISGLISLTARELTALSRQVACCPENAEAQVKRRQLLLDIRKQAAFCRAILRRWRRSIMVRQQLLEMRSEPLAYPAGLNPLQEL
jgi:hypothetical protein